ncbi:MAG: class I SAM-dependent rRNA methyltransferase [Planctomycetota bacterium]
MGKIIASGKGRRWLLGGHPWLYLDDVATGLGEPGELVPVDGPNQEPLGWGLFSTHSRIAVRMVTRSPEQPNREFWASRMRRAVERRRRSGLLDPESGSRLVSGDADGFPGLVIDRYAQTAVVQCGTQSADRMRDFILELLQEALPFELTTIVDRSDASVRKLEGLLPRFEVIKGALAGPVVVRDGTLSYTVDIVEGHKTGHYLDQAQNRKLAAALAVGGRVLDCFAYDGLFGLHAAAAGAEDVLCLEQNRAACERILENAQRNGLGGKVRVERVDCMKDLRARAERQERYELVVLDPPAFARSKKEVEGAERGYVELNRRGLELIPPGGYLVSASCSHNVRPADFMGFIASAARLAGRDVWLDALTKAGVDHPHLVTLPETDYLKCAFLSVG